MSYFSFIPFELSEIILSFLFVDDFNSFINSNNLSDSINWTTVYNLHFISKDTHVSCSSYLKDLSIEKIKFVFKLTDSIEEINSLQLLYLYKNKIKEIPKEIGNLINLNYLDLSDNKIKEIPKEIGNLTNLKRLDLNDNKIKEIPKEIVNLINLQTLYLSNNEIK